MSEREREETDNEKKENWAYVKKLERGKRWQDWIEERTKKMRKNGKMGENKNVTVWEKKLLVHY